MLMECTLSPFQWHFMAPYFNGIFLVSIYLLVEHSTRTTIIMFPLSILFRIKLTKHQVRFVYSHKWHLYPIVANVINKLLNFSNHRISLLLFFNFRMSAHTKIRTRLSSIGDSAPPSDSSEGSASESFEHGIDWTQQSKTQMHTSNSLFLSGSDPELHSLSPDNSGILSDIERAQVESFFSGLGTEVSLSVLSLRRRRYDKMNGNQK